MTDRAIAVAIRRRLFGMDEAEVERAMYRYIGNHKLLTMVFAFVPWLALVIIG